MAATNSIETQVFLYTPKTEEELLRVPTAMAIDSEMAQRICRRYTMRQVLTRAENSPANQIPKFESAVSPVKISLVSGAEGQTARVLLDGEPLYELSEPGDHFPVFGAADDQGYRDVVGLMRVERVSVRR